MKGIIVILLAGMAIHAGAQTPTAPKLTSTEQIALAAISEKLKAVQDQTKSVMDALHEVEAEIAKNHAGYHLNEATGGLEKDGQKPLPMPPAKDKK